MARLRESGLEYVNIIVKSDSELALTSLIESWSTLRAMKRRIEDDHRGQSCWKFEEQRVRRAFRTIRSASEEQWEVRMDVAHSVWPWIAERRDERGFGLGERSTKGRRAEAR